MAITVTKDDVMNALEALGVPASATAVSVKVGFTKKSSVVSALLAELVDDGEVAEGLSPNGFVTFGLVEEEDEEEEDYEDDEDVDDDDECCDDEPVAVEPSINDKLIANQRSNSDGFLPRISSEDYEIPEDLKNYKIVVTDYGFKVTFPDNGQDYDIDRTERVVVINNEYRVAVSTPEEIMGAIQEFTAGNGWKHFVVRDVATGSALAPGRVNMKPVIIFLEVERHNKAGK